MKPTLILLPGMLCDEKLWQHQLIHLAEIAQVQVGDLTQADSISGMASAILVEAPEQFMLAGLSLGGIVAFEIMRQAPQRVTNLALLDTTPDSMSQARAQPWEALAAMPGNQQFLAQAARRLIDMMHPANQEIPELIDIIENMVARIGPAGLQRQLQAQITRPDSWASLDRITCPTLVLVGSEDHTCPPELHQTMAERLPKATLAIVEHCGHLSSLEQPETITAHLRLWLQGNA